MISWSRVFFCGVAVGRKTCEINVRYLLVTNNGLTCEGLLHAPSDFKLRPNRKPVKVVFVDRMWKFASQICAVNTESENSFNLPVEPASQKVELCDFHCGVLECRFVRLELYFAKRVSSLSFLYSLVCWTHAPLCPQIGHQKKVHLETWTWRVFVSMGPLVQEQLQNTGASPLGCDLNTGGSIPARFSSWSSSNWIIVLVPSFNKDPFGFSINSVEMSSWFSIHRNGQRCLRVKK